MSDLFCFDPVVFSMGPNKTDINNLKLVSYSYDEPVERRPGLFVVCALVENLSGLLNCANPQMRDLDDDRTGSERSFHEPA
jgi:hypothetical protein